MAKARSNPELNQRNEEIIARAEAGVSQPDIAREMGLAVSTVRFILKQAGFRSPETAAPQGGKARTLLGRTPISRLHHQIGSRVYAFRSPRKEEGLTTVAATLGMSRQRLRTIECGLHDLTLSEVQKLAVLLDIPFLELVTERDLSRKGAPVSNTPVKGSHATATTPPN